MKKLVLSMAILAMAGVASADILVPNGDFSAGGADWGEAAGGGTVNTFSYPTTGGNPGGYGQLDSSAGAWAVLISNGDAPLPLSYFGLGLAGGDDIVVHMDMIELANDGGNTAGLKMESWSSTGHISNSGDVKYTLTDTWETYTWNYTIDPTATHLKFVPVQHDGISVGYDNVGVVPEPATLGLLGVAGGAMLFLRRRMRI